MKPRNTIMALVAKNDPTRYHTRSVEAEHVKLQKNRSRRRAKERREIYEGDLPPPRTLQVSNRDIIIAEANAWNIEFVQRVANIEIYRS
jgi:hypothetical protein